MSIREITEKIKGRVRVGLGGVGDRPLALVEAVRQNEKDIWILLVVILVAGLFFGLGRLTKIVGEREPIKITQPALVTASLAGGILTNNKAGAKAVANPISQPVVSQAKYVASKSGTRYYLPTCSGVKRIKEENKVWFNTIDEAKSAGYAPAANCPGI